MVKYNALKYMYEIEKTIGTGGFAKVKLATHLLTGEKVAIKIMNKNSIGDSCPRVKLELEALKNVSHHHICKLYQVIETKEHFFLIMEYCSGGELFDHIVEKSKLTEFEARLFFRQILSAVAYLHKAGYAHRDLKPENILLDKDLNLKLIDFGLCAKPHGGMASPLQTSCGSPTYAAPELIKGNHYLGAKVDVWSLGVLLYALMCGFLPFDCDNIESLYKKILSGKYSEPSWLSDGSKQIIREMLQVDPRNRITIDNLLSHDWVTMGCLDPVIYESAYKEHEKNNEVLNALGEYYMIGTDEMWEKINQWNYDYDTATYLLLLNKLKNGLPLKMTTQSRLRYRLKRMPTAVEMMFKEEATPVSNNSPIRQTYDRLKEAINNNELCSLESISEKENVRTPTRNTRKRSHPSNSEDHFSPQLYGKENMERTPLRNKRKRSHATGSEDIISPIPAKITPGKKSRTTQNVVNESPSTPSNSTPGNKLLCSIERKLNMVRNVLTPRKRNPLPEFSHPNVFPSKRLCNVSTTSFKDPDIAMEELKGALKEAGIECKSKGFLIKGKIIDSDKDCKLSFELEICIIQTTANKQESVIGIRRKRLKGDSWCYKKVCEQILKLTNSEKHI